MDKFGEASWNPARAALCADGASLPSKIVRKGILSKEGISWRLMTRALAQAGNRAGRTGRILQWWENATERSADASAVRKCYNSKLLFSILHHHRPTHAARSLCTKHRVQLEKKHERAHVHNGTREIDLEALSVSFIIQELFDSLSAVSRSEFVHSANCY